MISHSIDCVVTVVTKFRETISCRKRYSKKLQILLMILQYNRKNFLKKILEIWLLAIDFEYVTPVCNYVNKSEFEH